MKYESTLTPVEVARAYANRILGDDQFKNNKDAVEAIVKDWIAGFKAGRAYQHDIVKPFLDEARAICSLDSGVNLIAKEQIRSRQEEGYTAEHDDSHDQGELADAAAVYALSEGAMFTLQEQWGNDMYLHLWPFKLEELKKDETGAIAKRIKDLVKAGNLIASEIDRLKRLDNANDEGI